MKRIFAVSKWLHKYIGLFLLLYFLLIGTTGVLLNHPSVVNRVSVPARFFPASYALEDWNRGALRSALFLPDAPETMVLWGSQGVWISEDNGKTFQPLDQGFPKSAHGRRTNALLLTEEESPRLLAAANDGLFVAPLDARQWARIPLDDDHAPVRSVIAVKDSIVAFTDSRAYRAELAPRLTFAPVPFTRIDKVPSVSLVALVFMLHSGKIWGLPGRLLFDLAGIIMVFLSLSGIYMWYFPKRPKRLRKQAGVKSGRGIKCFQFFTRYHLKLGIWIAVIHLIIAATGLFMKPPLLMALVGKEVPMSAFPGLWPDNPWQGKINAALYNPTDDDILIEADGFWRGSADFSVPFRQVHFPISTFPMGANVFYCRNNGDITVGSFGGISRLEYATGNVVNLIEDEPYNIRKRGPVGFMVSGYFETPQGDAFVIEQNQGLRGIAGAPLDGRFDMPDLMRQRYSLPGFLFLFELHNGRIFRDLIGPYYVFIPMIGAISLILITLTGIYDWAFRKMAYRKKPRQRKAGSEKCGHPTPEAETQTPIDDGEKT